MTNGERDLGGEDPEILIQEVSEAVATGVVRGVEDSRLLTRMLDVLESLQARLTYLEQQLGDEALRNRVLELEKKLQALGEDGAGKAATDEEIEPAPPPRPPPPPLAPPANMPKNLSMANLPFGLSAPPNRPASSTRKSRSRTQSRPTVVYRTDPRAASGGDGQEATSGAESAGTEGDGKCLEPGCELPVECRGLCALHYQRLLHKETKADSLDAIGDAIPLPPPPRKRVQAGGGKKEGGTKGVFAVLYDEKGRRTLAGMINQMKFDRADLVERLNKQFAGMPGVPLEEEDVIRAIHYHKLGEALRTREGEIICRHLTKLKGSLGKAAQKMKIEIDQLSNRIDELGLTDEVARMRNEFREQIMEDTFSERLDLALTREKYLKDLGIESEVDESLRAELQVELDRVKNDTAVDRADETIQAALKLDEQHYRRMVRRYDLETVLGELTGLSAVEGEG